MLKKFFGIILVVVVVCSSLTIPVSANSIQLDNGQDLNDIDSVTQAVAATGYFSGSTGTMNSLNGSQSRVFNMSSGSINNNSTITTIETNVTVSSGSSPFYLVLVDPSGYSASVLVTSSGAVTFTAFNGRNAKGTWKTYIVTTGLVSTATARYKFYYQY
jgi:hypothetical protein